MGIQRAKFRSWTSVVVSIFYNGNHYNMNTRWIYAGTKIWLVSQFCWVIKTEVPKIVSNGDEMCKCWQKHLAGQLVPSVSKTEVPKVVNHGEIVEVNAKDMRWNN